MEMKFRFTPPPANKNKNKQTVKLQRMSVENTSRNRSEKKWGKSQSRSSLCSFVIKYKMWHMAKKGWWGKGRSSSVFISNIIR